MSKYVLKHNIFIHLLQRIENNSAAQSSEAFYSLHIDNRIIAVVPFFSHSAQYIFHSYSALLFFLCVVLLTRNTFEDKHTDYKRNFVGMKTVNKISTRHTSNFIYNHYFRARYCCSKMLYKSSLKKEIALYVSIPVNSCCKVFFN